MTLYFKSCQGELKVHLIILLSLANWYTVKCVNFRTPENCCNLPKIQIKRHNLRVFCQKDANGIANSEDPDQTAPLGAV